MTCCPFCSSLLEPVLENSWAWAFYDRHPVFPGHLLIIPKAHKLDYFHLSQVERLAIEELLIAAKAMLDHKFKPAGYNIGWNCGAAAGQTIFHCHCHVIPRYQGDTRHPRGGVRGVIPEKMAY